MNTGLNLRFSQKNGKSQVFFSGSVPFLFRSNDRELRDIVLINVPHRNYNWGDEENCGGTENCYCTPTFLVTNYFENHSFWWLITAFSGSSSSITALSCCPPSFLPMHLLWTNRLPMPTRLLWLQGIYSAKMGTQTRQQNHWMLRYVLRWLGLRTLSVLRSGTW